MADVGDSREHELPRVRCMRACVFSSARPLALATDEHAPASSNSITLSVQSIQVTHQIVHPWRNTDILETRGSFFLSAEQYQGIPPLTLQDTHTHPGSSLEL